MVADLRKIQENQRVSERRIDKFPNDWGEILPYSWQTQIPSAFTTETVRTAEAYRAGAGGGNARSFPSVQTRKYMV